MLKLRKCLALITVCVMLLAAMQVSAGAKSASDESPKSNIAECANELREYFETQEASKVEDVDSEFLANNYASCLTYDKIISHVDNYDDELRRHFAGAYVNDDGYLVVMLSCDSDACEGYVCQSFDNCDIVFSTGIGSYYEGQRELNLINERIGALQNDIATGMLDDEEAKSLMALKPTASYNDSDNTISLSFNLPLGAALSQAEYQEAISLFESKIYKSDLASFSVAYGEAETVLL